MECRQSGLTDHQWCVEHDIKPGTFYNWVKRLRQKGCVDLPASTGRTYCAPESQEVVRVDFHDTDPIPCEQPLNVIPAATERNNLSVAEPMKLSIGSFHLTIPNGTDPQLLAQTLRIVKESFVMSLSNISSSIIKILYSFFIFSSPVMWFPRSFRNQPDTGHFYSTENTILRAIIVYLTGGNAPFFTCLSERHIIHIHTSDNPLYYISFVRRIQVRR